MEDIPSSSGYEAAITAPQACGASAGLSWLSAAWQLFKSSWLEFLLAGVLVFLIRLLLSWLPVIGDLLGLFVTPLLVAGLMQMAAKAHADDEPGIGDLFVAFKGDARACTTKLLGLGLVTLLGLLGVSLVIGLVMFGAGVGGMMMAADPQQMAAGMMQQMQQMGPLLVVVGVVMLVLMVLYSCAMWLAVPLIWLGDCRVFEALRLSLAASKRNAGGLLVFGLVCLVLLFLSVLTLGLGLLVVVPVLSIASFTAYQQIFATDVKQLL